ncbi:ATP-dependent helicase [Lichenibacterium dinghuense]|uniref:ATP-dependent helicase n=1 Tax=Lichenibacterium dinghuense TaxID=2895977 RepID=UPI001F16C95D|nr:ATP-dependent helicase [Lichenibacterium sp. 6Y81]
MAGHGLTLATYKPSPSLPDRAFLFGKTVGVSVIVPEPERPVEIAHEVGHAVMHRDPRLGVGRSRRGADGGLLMNGYSTRQRVEIQAILFADEVLCPSTKVRGLLAAGMGVTDIATGLRLPESIVVRQATHALLPPDDRPPRAWRRVDLDARQRECASWSDGPLLVIGAAGTGKSTVVAERLLELVDRTRGSPPSSTRAGDTPATILAIASTPWAAEALEEHVAAHDPAMVGQVAACTLVEFAHDIVVRWPDRIKRDGRVRVADRTEAIGILADLPTESPARVLRDLAAGRIEGSTENGVEAEFARELARRNAVYAGDVLAMAVRVLAEDEVLVAELRHRHRHVLVDDLQDVPPAGLELLRVLCEGGPGLWATGDAGQAVDRHRGAGADGVVDFERRFGGRTLRLERRYRARNGGVLALHEALDGPSGRRRGCATGGRLTVTPDFASEAEAIRDGIEELRAAGVPLREQALLARSHKMLDNLTGALAALGVPVLTLGDVRLRHDVLALKAVLALAADHHPTVEEFLALAASPPYGVPARDAGLVLACASQKGSTPRRILASLRDLPDLGRDAAEGLARLATDLVALASRTGHKALVAWILDRPGTLAQALRPDASLEDRLGLVAAYQVLVVCEEGEALGSGDLPSLLDRIDNQNAFDRPRLHRHVTLSTADIDAVRAMTMPASRGMEFRAVHIGGMRKLGRVVGEHDAEDEIFRVAVTRASEHVRLYRASRYGRRDSAASPHLAKLEGLLQVVRRA